MYIHVTYLYNSIDVITSQTRWFIDVHVVQKTTPRIGWGEELLVILIVGGKINGFPAAIFPHQSLEQGNAISKKPLKSIQDILRWFDDTFEDTFGAYPKWIQHLQSKDSFHKASMACWGRISLSSLKPWSNRLRCWVLPMVVTGEGWLDEAKKGFIQYVFNRWYIYIYYTYTNGYGSKPTNHVV